MKKTCSLTNVQCECTVRVRLSQCWLAGFISEFLHGSEPQELGKSVTWFKLNNNERPNTHTHTPPPPADKPFPLSPPSPTSEGCFHFSLYRGEIKPDTCTGGILENKCYSLIWIIYGSSTRTHWIQGIMCSSKNTFSTWSKEVKKRKTVKYIFTKRGEKTTLKSTHISTN